MRLASDSMTGGPLQQGLLLHGNVDSEDGGEIDMERDGFMNVPRRSAFCPALDFVFFFFFFFLVFFLKRTVHFGGFLVFYVLVFLSAGIQAPLLI